MECAFSIFCVKEIIQKEQNVRELQMKWHQSNAAMPTSGSWGSQPYGVFLC